MQSSAVIEAEPLCHFIFNLLKVLWSFFPVDIVYFPVEAFITSVSAGFMKEDRTQPFCLNIQFLCMSF